MKYDILFWDLDGTITDSGEGILKSAQYALEKFGIIEPDLNKLKHFIGPPLKQEFMEVYGFDDEKAARAVTIYRERYTPIGLFENKLYDGIEEVLKEFKNRGKLLVIATSKPQVMADTILKYFDVYDYFDIVVGADLVGGIQTKAQVVEKALALTDKEYDSRYGKKAEKSSIIMIGDRKYDVLGAKAYDINCIGATYGYGTKDELLEAGAIDLAETPQALLSIIN